MFVLELCSFTWCKTSKFKCNQYTTAIPKCQTNPRRVLQHGGVILLGWFFCGAPSRRPLRVKAQILPCANFLGRAWKPAPTIRRERPWCRSVFELHAVLHGCKTGPGFIWFISVF